MGFFCCTGGRDWYGGMSAYGAGAAGTWAAANGSGEGVADSGRFIDTDAAGAPGEETGSEATGGTSSSPEPVSAFFAGAGREITSSSSFTSDARALAAEGFHPPAAPASGAPDAAATPPAATTDAGEGLDETMDGLDGLGARCRCSSVTSESGIQSAMPARQQRLSGPISPRSQCSLSTSMPTGPT